MLCTIPRELIFIFYTQCEAFTLTSSLFVSLKIFAISANYTLLLPALFTFILILFNKRRFFA
ncbi:hypothetical protein C2G38_2053850 [Gigaspora rosea]|uniref:Uncharacterized protein n=1 Tax=Gigaspora rosea TaxID=44941 RepID=A0A397WDG8_9GLOM|nr:hypothetical protein C2G38_2053850 [Gigaspora rosea]